jgi:hypothetical protein
MAKEFPNTATVLQTISTAERFEYQLFPTLPEYLCSTPFSLLERYRLEQFTRVCEALLSRYEKIYENWEWPLWYQPTPDFMDEKVHHGAITTFIYGSVLEELARVHESVEIAERGLKLMNNLRGKRATSEALRVDELALRCFKASHLYSFSAKNLQIFVDLLSTNLGTIDETNYMGYYALNLRIHLALRIHTRKSEIPEDHVLGRVEVLVRDDITRLICLMEDKDFVALASQTSPIYLQFEQRKDSLLQSLSRSGLETLTDLSAWLESEVLLLPDAPAFTNTRLARDRARNENFLSSYDKEARISVPH